MNEILWLLLFWWIGTRILKAGRLRRKKNVAVPPKRAGAVEQLIAALLIRIKKQAAGRGAESLSPAPWERDAVVDHRDIEGGQSSSGQKWREKEVTPQPVAAFRTTSSHGGMVKSSVALSPPLVESVAVAPATSKQRKFSLQQAVVWSEILAPPVALREK